MKRNGLFAGMVAVWAFLLGGCVWPGDVDSGILHRYQRYLAEIGPQQRRGTTGLDSLQPSPGTTGPELPTSRDPDTGTVRVFLSLDDAIMRALANNMDIRAISYNPSIAREDMIKAAAEFDYTVFGSALYQNNDVQTTSIFGGGQTENRVYQAGLRQKTITGAQWQLAWTMTRTWDNSAFSTLRTIYEPTVVFEVTQPLLRDAWPEFNLSRFNIARVSHKQSVTAFRRGVEETMTTVIAAYWGLVQARRDLEIQQKLFDVTKETYKRVKAREELDATAVQIKQTEAAKESRRAFTIRAAKVAKDAQDALARLLADAQLNLLEDYEIVPVTEAAVIPVEINQADRLMTAMQFNPVLVSKRLDIETAGIGVRIAFNQALPKVDLVATGGLQGLAGARHQSLENFSRGDYASYSFGITAEYPLGNRQREAELRLRRLIRLQAVTELQNLLDQVALQVRERIRQVRTAHLEMQAQRAAMDAAKAQLQALEDTEIIRGRLTPEFLQVKLGAQEAVATAARAELRAIIEYNTTLADLDRITGTILETHRVQIAFPVAAGEADWPRPQSPVPAEPSAAAEERPAQRATAPLKDSDVEEADMPASIPATQPASMPDTP